MSIKLFEHNQTAFDDALEMLEETGKAAVVHPTGTGKSYIGFKLCEQFPDKIICWLSPSEYIYKTQLENLKEDSDGWQPENVKFFTYAKLMLMTEVELQEIQPNFIILDEFHRCGAEMWGDGVNRLLEMYPDVPILGLTATAIRYLDNQRNMVDELFDGNIASEMTLGEAIVRGILNPPKYVLSVFAYQEDYDKLKRRVSRSKNKAVKDKAEQYLESLRRALEMVDGMDVIFDKHITDRTGKYIVFCSNIDHLREMQSNVASWFSKIDKEPHIYTAYSLDSSTEQEFADFKKDESEHLKLLFCIDMLNEGVHVENISGVILFRPTVSPIIYKQQIGRALSASKTKNWISSIKSARLKKKKNYQFTDEQIEALNKIGMDWRSALDIRWEENYNRAKAYYKAFGNLDIPPNFLTDDGQKLGRWIREQRKRRRLGRITQEQIELLDQIEMNWDGHPTNLSWEQWYQFAKAYYEEHGDLEVPPNYKVNGYWLGKWISNQREIRSGKQEGQSLTVEQISLLDAIKMRWRKQSEIAWLQQFERAEKYYSIHGDLKASSKSSDPLEKTVGAWLTVQKRRLRNGELTTEQLDKLQTLRGFSVVA